MKRISVFFVLVITLALGAVGCSEAIDDDDTVNDDARTVQQASSRTYTDDDGCTYRCQPCPPNRACTAMCEPIGSCNKERPVEECGDTMCPAGTECCDAHCGTCVEPGGTCTLGC